MSVFDRSLEKVEDDPFSTQSDGAVDSLDEGLVLFPLRVRRGKGPELDAFVE